MERWLNAILICVILAFSQPCVEHAMPPPEDTDMDAVIFKFDRVDLKKINNPFNIRPSSSKWKGETGVSDGFVVFDTMENGARAGVINLANGYFNKSINTIATIVAKYAPASENDDTKYISFLVEKLKIAKGTKITPVHDTFRDVAYYISWYENGSSDVCTKEILNLILDKYGFEYTNNKITFTKQ